MPAGETTTNTRTDVAELARLIGLHARYDGLFPLRVPGVDVYRASRAVAEVIHAIQQASRLHRCPGCGEHWKRWLQRQRSRFAFPSPRHRLVRIRIDRAPPDREPQRSAGATPERPAGKA